MLSKSPGIVRHMNNQFRDAVLSALALSAILPLSAQSLDDAEVRLPYGELKQLLAAAQIPSQQKPAELAPALLSSRLRLGIEDGLPTIDLTARVAAFGEGMAFIPLIGGEVSLEKSEPADAIIVTRENALCLVLSEAGNRSVDMRLLASSTADGFTLTLPPCPSMILETTGLPEGSSVQITYGKQRETLGGNQRRALPGEVGTLHIRVLTDTETRAALSPPEPSTWTWQHQALVIPEDDALFYQLSTSATTAAGSGVAALLPMPQDARDITVSGEDLISHNIVRGEDRSLALALNWSTRGILDRRLQISYRAPIGPLDHIWKLHAPGADDTRTRFMIATRPLLGYAAENLSPPRPAIGLPSEIIGSLNGNPCQFLEAATTAELAVTLIPVAETAEGVIRAAEWSLKIEPDGAMLTTGMLVIDHKGPFDLTLDTPQDMKLLSCELKDQRITPVDLGDGRLKLSLPANGGNSLVKISFTGLRSALDPVEGTLNLALPQTPVFIHTLSWAIEMPSIYQAEIHGNLTRSTSTDKSGGSRIHLTKNLCRDERPEVNVFYQRADIRR